ncbi:MAG TPA: molybdopterin-synthase adenylyltransferase MoeB [Firmicutes bacterium]|nr:molybdopterin-synthase adenylyltransferase MoeB [Bacillota bacterium]
MLTDKDLIRYSRQMVMPGFGEGAQHKLLGAKVLVVGAGGLGSPVLSYLTAAGIGQIGIVDPDVVDLSNLQRQVIHSTASLGIPKVFSAKMRLQQINPGIQVQTYQTELTAKTAVEIIPGYDLVVDCVDNLATRYVVNDACVALQKPLIEAGVTRYEGLITTIIPGKSPCYRCIFPNPPADDAIPSPAQTGVLGSTPGVIGAMQATEAIKLILGAGRTLAGRLMIVDLLDMECRLIEVERSANCPSCSWLDDLAIARAELERDNSIAVVAVKGGQVIGKESGRRLLPLIRLVDSLGLTLHGASVADKVVGLAAARVLLAAGVRAVFGKIMSQSALEQFKRDSVPAHFSSTVPCIQGPGGNSCPMEGIARAAQTHEEALTKLRQALKHMP